jgi:hypothetical protein
MPHGNCEICNENGWLVDGMCEKCYESRTGKCFNCEGTGKVTEVLASWDEIWSHTVKKIPTIQHTCPKCQGSGRA